MVQLVGKRWVLLTQTHICEEKGGVTASLGGGGGGTVPFFLLR